MFPAQALAPGRSWRSVTDRAGAVGALILAVTLLRLLMAAVLPLLPQEAYYWNWSRELDWSYFDHPPLVAYAIALSTALVGQTVFGIKLAAVAWSLGWNLLWARLVLDMFGSRRLAFWSVAVLNLCLLYLSMGVTSTPDGPLLFGSRKAPDVNMCLPPLAWQTYDVEVKADDKGDLRATVWHNGVKIHEGYSVGKKGAKPTGINLQDHGNAVRFRNIWVRPLD